MVALAAAVVVGLAQPRADATRRERQLDSELYFQPSAEGVRLAASGFEEAIADGMWVRATLIFGERYASDDSVLWHAWLTSVIGVVSHLDPGWRTPYLYGGGMLSAVGLTTEAADVYERCSRELPDDYWCPFARGMNDLLYNDDPAAAARWLAVAAERPGAPTWYGAAAAAMRSRAGQRKAGVAYLKEQLATTDNEGVRRSLEYQLGRLQHDELVAGWTEECVARRESGRRLRNPEELPPKGFSLPDNPRGDAWVVGADGVVRSAGAEVERVRRVRRQEWALLHP